MNPTVNKIQSTKLPETIGSNLKSSRTEFSNDVQHDQSNQQFSELYFVILVLRFF